MDAHGAAPRWLWRAALGALIASLVFTVGLLALSLAGVSDPQPVGTLAFDGVPTLPTGVMLPEAAARRFVAADVPFTPPGTLELSARLAGGPPESGYGLWWGTSADDATVVAVNGDGYYAVFTIADGAVRYLEDWQRFPHVRLAGEANRLRVDVEEDQVTVLINDEFATSFEMEAVGASTRTPLQVGFYVETLGAGGAQAAFERLRVWQAE